MYCGSLRKKHYHINNDMAAVQVSLPLPVLPQGWPGEKGFKAVGELSSATQRNIEPVGPHFLAHARRVSDHQSPSRYLRCVSSILIRLAEAPPSDIF